MVSPCIVGLLVVGLVCAATACNGAAEPATAPTTTTPTPTTARSVEVPAGVTLTDPGASLDIGEPATAVYDDPQRASVLTVRVTKVAEGSVKDLKGFVLSAKDRSSTPYYVSATVTNQGPQQLGQTSVPLYGLDSTGTALPPTSMVGDFERCAGGPLPTGFAPGDSVATCLVYLIPPKAALAAVQLRTSDADDPISWSVD